MRKASPALVVEVRPIPPADARVRKLIGMLDELQTAVYPAESNHLDSIETLERDNVTFFAAFLDGEVVGCGAVKRMSERYGEIKRMYVEPSARGRGVGKALLVALEFSLLRARHRPGTTGDGHPPARGARPLRAVWVLPYPPVRRLSRRSAKRISREAARLSAAAQRKSCTGCDRSGVGPCRGGSDPVVFAPTGSRGSGVHSYPCPGHSAARARCVPSLLRFPSRRWRTAHRIPNRGRSTPTTRKRSRRGSSSIAERCTRARGCGGGRPCARST